MDIAKEKKKKTRMLRYLQNIKFTESYQNLSFLVDQII